MYSTAAFSINGWDSTKYRGFFRTSPQSPIDLGSRPLPIFTFTGDDICIVYSPTYKAREDRTKLFGSLGHALRYIPPFDGGESQLNELANIDVRVLADGNVLSMFSQQRYSGNDILGYFREDGHYVSNGDGSYYSQDTPMWWMAPGGGWLRCTVRDSTHHAIVKFSHPYHHEANHQASNPLELGPGSDSTSVVVEVIRVTPDAGDYLATYSYYYMDPGVYDALSTAVDAPAAETVLGGANEIDNLRDYIMQAGSASGLVHLAFSAMNEGSRLGLIPTLVDPLHLEDEQSGLVFTGEEDPSGTQYGGVWHDFPWLDRRDDWQAAPANPHTTVRISTTIDVMDFDGQLLHLVDAGEGFNGYGGPYICPETDIGLAPVNQLVLSDLEAPETTATIFRPAVTFVLYHLS